jgi:hypothetical protein
VTSSCSLENCKTEGQLEAVDNNDSPDEKKDATVCVANSSDTKAYIVTESMDSEQKLHDLNSTASSFNEVKSAVVKHVYNSFNERNPKYSEKDKSCSGVDNGVEIGVEIGKACVRSQKPEVLLKGKKLSLLPRKLNGYSCEQGVDADDVPTLSKKETSV